MSKVQYVVNRVKDVVNSNSVRFFILFVLCVFLSIVLVMSRLIGTHDIVFATAGTLLLFGAVFLTAVLIDIYVRLDFLDFMDSVRMDEYHEFRNKFDEVVSELKDKGVLDVEDEEGEDNGDGGVAEEVKE